MTTIRACRVQIDDGPNGTPHLFEVTTQLAQMLRCYFMSISAGRECRRKEGPASLLLVSSLSSPHKNGPVVSIRIIVMRWVERRAPWR